MLGVAAVHQRHGELAAANPQARSVSQKAGGCRVETRSKQSSMVKLERPKWQFRARAFLVPELSNHAIIFNQFKT